MIFAWIHAVSTLEGSQDASFGKKYTPYKAIYKSLDPKENNSVRYRMTIQEEMVWAQEEEYIEIKQKWEWTGGCTSEYRNRLMKDPSPGRAISGLRKEYDKEGNLLLEESTNYLQAPEDYPPNAYPYTALFTVHRNLLEHLLDGEKFEFFSVFPGSAMVKINSVYSGRETVKVGDTSVECFKIRMWPDMSFFIGNVGVVVNVFVRWFMPRSCMWFLAEQPHVLIRYEGLSGGEKEIRPVVYEIEENSLRSILHGKDLVEPEPKPR